MTKVKITYIILYYKLTVRSRRIFVVIAVMNEYIYIISEYNPPHGGHRHMIEELRRLYPDAVVTAVMSGSFAERGSPAIVNRFTRARAALSIGADLVVSLPFPWCMGSAEFFARAGVHIADSLASAHPDAHHILAFGSECGDTEVVALAGQRLADEDFRHELYRKGAEYHTARGMYRFYAERFGTDAAAILSTPNDTLGVEYVRAVTELNALLTPLAVKRIGARHDSADEDIYPSASAVRERIYSRDPNALELLPESVRAIIASDLHKYGIAHEDNYGDAILSSLRRMTTDNIGIFAECCGGVGERLIAASHQASSYAEMLSLAATKQYTNARLRRAAIYAYLGVRRDNIAELPKYTQLLAANKRGTDALHGMVRRARIEILTKSADYGKMSADAARQYELDRNADALYTLAFSPHLPSNIFMRQSPFIITEHTER